MNKKNLIIAVLLMVAGFASAQETVEYEDVFTPHWYVGVQGGAQYTVGEGDFSTFLSPNAQVSVGYRFNPVVGLRFGVNGWQSKGALQGHFYDIQSIMNNVQDVKPVSFNREWKYNYIAPNVDFTVDLTNLIWGYKPNRVFSLGAFAGVGVNFAFKNDEAVAVSNEIAAIESDENVALVGEELQNMAFVWDGTKARLQGRFGLTGDFRLSDRVSLGLEVNANVINDHYNSKQSHSGANTDWYFNALAGVKINLGKTHSKRKVVKPEPLVIEKIVEKPVEKIVEKVVEKVVERPVAKDAREEIRRDIFFLISSTQLRDVEVIKVKEIAEFLKKHPETKVNISGYADKGTGSAKINQSLSEKRVQVVVDELKRLGISEDRIGAREYFGDTVQPYEINELNRLSICIVE